MGHQEKGMARKSIPLNEEIRRTTEVTGTTRNNPQIRRRRDPSDVQWCRKVVRDHCTDGHDLEECKTFLDHKRMPPPVAPAPQDPHRGEHCREISDGDEHMVEINVIFGGSMSITFKI
jgi:hypothetical protein